MSLFGFEGSSLLPKPASTNDFGGLPGSQLLSARLFLEVHTVGDRSTLRLNGKPPIDIVEAGACGLGCTVLAVWDFDNEARTVAAQGGGELSVRIDPIAPLVQQSPNRSSSTALVAFRPAVNYPWAQGSVFNSLILRFGVPACPPLTLTAIPPSVRPQLPPGTTFTEAVRSAPTKANIEAHVCVPGSPSTSVEVKLEVRPPSPGSADAGGHNHDGFRVQCTGTFTQPRAGTALGGCDKNAPGGGTLRQASCMATLNAQGKGSCTVTYFPFFMGGIETIAACINRQCAPGSADAQIPIRVEVPGLQNPAQVFQNLAFKDRPFLLTGQTTTHPDNHWGTPATITAIRGIAFDYFNFELSPGVILGATLSINDMSLRQGGLFDICHTWNPFDVCPPLTRAKPPGGHQSHRTGTGVDIRARVGIRASSCFAVRICALVRPFS